MPMKNVNIVTKIKIPPRILIYRSSPLTLRNRSILLGAFFLLRIRTSLSSLFVRHAGCQLVLGAFLENSNLQLINFTSCLLTSKSANVISSFLRKKRSKILENVWHETQRKGTSSHQVTIIPSINSLSKAIEQKDNFFLKNSRKMFVNFVQNENFAFRVCKLWYWIKMENSVTKVCAHWVSRLKTIFG